MHPSCKDCEREEYDGSINSQSRLVTKIIPGGLWAVDLMLEFTQRIKSSASQLSKHLTPSQVAFSPPPIWSIIHFQSFPSHFNFSQSKMSMSKKNGMLCFSLNVCIFLIDKKIRSSRLPAFRHTRGTSLSSQVLLMLTKMKWGLS